MLSDSKEFISDY